MSKELTAAIAVCTANNVPTSNLGEAQIIQIASALSAAAATSQIETLSKQLAESKKALNTTVGELKMTPIQKAVKRAKDNAKESMTALQTQLDDLRQAQAAETGAKLGAKISDTTTKIDEVLTDKVPGVSHMKGFFRGLTGSLRN